jgi:hypothetical protein
MRFFSIFSIIFFKKTTFFSHNKFFFTFFISMSRILQKISHIISVIGSKFVKFEPAVEPSRAVQYLREAFIGFIRLTFINNNSKKIRLSFLFFHKNLYEYRETPRSTRKIDICYLHFERYLRRSRKSNGFFR